MKGRLCSYSRQNTTITRGEKYDQSARVVSKQQSKLRIVSFCVCNKEARLSLRLDRGVCCNKSSLRSVANYHAAIGLHGSVFCKDFYNTVAEAAFWNI